MNGVDFDDKPDDGVGEFGVVGSVDVLERAVPVVGSLALTSGITEKRNHGRGTEAAAAEVVRLVRLNGRRRVSGTKNIDPVQLYLNDIGQYQLLTKDDEVRLSAEIFASNAALEKLANEDIVLTEEERTELLAEVERGNVARGTFANANLKLVVSIAKNYYKNPDRLLERIQLGNQGLIHAVEKFDGRKGFKFSTYATWWIRVAIKKGVENIGRSIPIPIHIQDSIAAYRRASERFIQDHRRNGSIDEIIAYSKLDPKKIKNALWYQSDILSLNDEAYKDGDLELGDTIDDKSVERPEDKVVRELTAEGIASSLDILSEHERVVVELLFGIGHERSYTFVEIAGFLKVKKTFVEALRSKAFSKLRHPSLDLLMNAEEWRQDADCLGVDIDLFFPGRGENTNDARKVCKRCSVRKDCQMYALDNKDKATEKYGIWGGTSERERRRTRSLKSN